MSIPDRLRDQLADTATRLGPDAPTLCPPWSVRDLLAHLVVRESRPDALPGVALPVPALREHTRKVQDGVAAQDFPALVERARRGPAAYWPTRIGVLDRAVNTAELAVHLEDLVRAQPDWRPSELDEATQAQLMSVLRTAGRLLYASSPVGVVAVAPGRGRVALRRPPAGRGTVVLTGTPLELLLHAFGRTSVAQVQIDGAPADVEALAGQNRRL